ncbi:MAG: hypothetical protein C5B59_00960 [Bacteroidetes bacterium]|nr:MAG: hypothetical protein C5B59_00960 [Bacteroidota bacterium]
MPRLFSEAELLPSKHFYRVWIYLDAPIAGEDEITRSYDHEEEFHDSDLRIARKKALNYYFEWLSSYPGKCWDLPSASPKDFVWGKHSRYSINLALVESFLVDEEGDDGNIESNTDENQSYIIGEDYDSVMEGRKEERLLFEGLGLPTDDLDVWLPIK